MNPDRQHAIDYLRAPANRLWRWAEDGAVLVWRDGGTIAFREEIAQILEWLAPNGLPPFGAIVFLLAACRGKTPEVTDLVIESNVPLSTPVGGRAVVLLSARNQLKMQITAALDRLRKVASLPAELNTGIKARCLLAEAVFEPAKAERHVERRAVLRGLREPMSDVELSGTGRVELGGNCIRQIHILAEGLKLHTPESLALRLRTGLDALPSQIDAHLPTAELARRLIEELSRDPEIGSVARAARELMAAVRLPRRLGEPEQLAVGGVADITNRGPLDRLLVSELAHDDLTLSVRVALNEALYVRREPPMREPPGTLALLLDSGVRLWGVPRALATAVALALIASDRHHCDVRAWRSRGKQLVPLDLLSRNGLTLHLGALETEAHPGGALPAFAETVAPGAQNQSVLVTHRDTLDDPEFRRALAEHSAAPGFVATVDREGHFELHALPLARRPPLCEADLELESVFGRETGVPPIKVEVDSNLPAIFGVRPFPFLLPIPGRTGFWTRANDGFTYAVLNDRRLVQFRDQRTGGRVLTNEVPGGRTVWMDCMEGTVHVVKDSAGQRSARLLSWPLPDGPLRVTDLTAGPCMRAVHRYGEVLVLTWAIEVRAHALSDGRLLGRAPNSYPPAGGRYFRGQHHFYFAVWDGANVKFEPVTLPGTVDFDMVLRIFDREGMEGPWLLIRGGEIVSTVTGERTKLQYPPTNAGLDFRIAHVARSGHRLWVPAAPRHQAGAPTGCVFDLTRKQCQILHRSGPDVAEVPPALPVWNLLRVVESIARLKDGLAICGRKNRWRKIRLSTQGGLVIVDLPPHETEELIDRISFGTQVEAASRGCTLQAAEWPCGSKAFLDSRGLVHLKSHDPAVPEISLVLSDGEVAGWTSDGLVCGYSFFFEGIHASEPKRVFERILQFLYRL